MARAGSTLCAIKFTSTLLRQGLCHFKGEIAKLTAFPAVTMHIL